MKFAPAIAVFTAVALSSPVLAESPSEGELRFVSYIRAKPEQVWRALIEPEQTTQYFHKARIELEPKREGCLRYRYAESGEVAIEGRVLAIEEGRRLRFTFRFPGVEDLASEVEYRLETAGRGTTKLTIAHRFRKKGETFRMTSVGWPPVVSGLKTWLETGRPLVIERE